MSEYNPANAHKFYNQGMEQLDKLVLDEFNAKEMILAGFVMGESVILMGAPGGGKSTLSRDAYRMFDDISTKEVAIVPHNSELTPLELVGGFMSTEKVISGDGGYKKETINATVKPIIHEDTKIIWMDEINRVNPWALNSVLNALQSGEVTTGAGITKLNGLELAISTMNPSEKRQATYTITDAIASRHAMGAIMGGDKADSEKRLERIGKIRKGWVSQPENIEPISNTNELHALRQSSLLMPIPGSLEKRTDQLIMRTIDTLASEKIEESDGRITGQITKIAQTLALLRAEKQVQEKDLNDAIGYVISARLGALARKSFSQTQEIIEDTIK
ncbi:MAG: hypothetical protein NVSMB46_04280 [Candidatus Saccharimonadales bacterium]